tara:strand:+ start:190 stop:363 length:174 start_codon:yes stop_codon:yes gene_type:complete
MKEPRVEKIVAELIHTVERLNRITNLLEKTGTTFHLYKKTNNEPYQIKDLEQRIKYE